MKRQQDFLRVGWMMMAVLTLIGTLGMRKPTAPTSVFNSFKTFNVEVISGIIH